MKKIMFREEYCMACRLCEIHCLTAHSKSKKILKAYKEEFPKALPRLVVEQKGIGSFALQCRHCAEAPCLDACSSGAMQRDADGHVMCDTNKCAGCWMCVMVCPFGAIRPNLIAKIPIRCDKCKDKDEPACLKACPTGAIIWQEEREK